MQLKGRNEDMAKTYNVGVMGGDGTGPEVTREAIKVLKVAGADEEEECQRTGWPALPEQASHTEGVDAGADEDPTGGPTHERTWGRCQSRHWPACG